MSQIDWNSGFNIHPKKYMTFHNGEYIEYVVGDWVQYKEEHRTFTGFIVDIEIKIMATTAKVCFTDCTCKNFKSRVFNTIYEIPIPRLILDKNIQYTEEFLKSAIDFALDIKDETLFNDYSKKLSKLKK